MNRRGLLSLVRKRRAQSKWKSKQIRALPFTPPVGLKEVLDELYDAADLEKANTIEACIRDLARMLCEGLEVECPPNIVVRGRCTDDGIQGQLAFKEYGVLSGKRPTSIMLRVRPKTRYDRYRSFSKLVEITVHEVMHHCDLIHPKLGLWGTWHTPGFMLRIENLCNVLMAIRANIFYRRTA